MRKIGTEYRNSTFYSENFLENISEKKGKFDVGKSKKKMWELKEADIEKDIYREDTRCIVVHLCVPITFWAHRGKVLLFFYGSCEGCP